MKNIEKYIQQYPGTPSGKASSVHYESTFRIDKARKQTTFNSVPVEIISEYVNEFLELADMLKIENPTFELDGSEIDYDEIKEQYKLKDVKDIVWLRFTKDGDLTTVAVSNDINFIMPKDETEYNDVENGKWKYPTASIIVHKLGKRYDESFVLLFPLVNIPDGLTSHDIETGIGNYLIEQGVPILDFYSHNY